MWKWTDDRPDQPQRPEGQREEGQQGNTVRSGYWTRQRASGENAPRPFYGNPHTRQRGRGGGPPGSFDFSRLSAERSTSSAPQSRQSTPAEGEEQPLGAVGGEPLNQSLHPLQPESSDDRQKLPFSADCNDRVQDLLDSRGGPTSQSAGGLRDTTTKSEYRPAEKMTRDPRGDWIPRQDDRPIVRPKDNKPDWSRLEEARVRPFATRLPPMGEKVDPNTSHGRFLTGLLEKMEERERRSQQGSLTDTDSVRSYRLSYSEKPKRLTKLGFPFREDDESPASGGLDEVERLRKELRDARTTINRLQEDGYTSSASSYAKRDERPRYRRERAPEVKNLKVPKFNGKDFAGFRLAFMKCAKLLRWDEEQAQTQLICTCEGTSRNVLMSLPEDTSVIDMLHALELRYGINLSYATVDNKLVDIRRKPGESLHSLYDRVVELARRADYSPMERAYKMRHAFFQALRTDMELQHYVGRHDKADPPSIDVTLAYALQYEMTHGRRDLSSSSSAKHVSTTDCSFADTDDSEAVHRLQFTSLKQAKDPLIKQLGMQQNELVELMKKQAKLLEQHLDQPRQADRSKTGRYSSATGQPSVSQRTNKDYKSTNNKKFVKKGRFDKRKPGFKPKSKVNQIEEQDEEEEQTEWEDATAEGGTSDCSTPEPEEDHE